jgi:hypothetical protein
LRGRALNGVIGYLLSCQSKAAVEDQPVAAAGWRRWRNTLLNGPVVSIEGGRIAIITSAPRQARLRAGCLAILEQDCDFHFLLKL